MLWTSGVDLVSLPIRAIASNALRPIRKVSLAVVLVQDWFEELQARVPVP